MKKTDTYNRGGKNMSVYDDLFEVGRSLANIEKTGMYDVEKYSCSIKHLTNQLEYFYCHLVPKSGRTDNTYYHLHHRPKEHEMAYFNIGRGFPKELMDGHRCYILKDLGYKMLVIPSTSVKKDSKECHPHFEMDIDVLMDGHLCVSRIQLSDIRSIDVQRLDVRKSFCEVKTPRKKIVDFTKNNLLG